MSLFGLFDGLVGERLEVEPGTDLALLVAPAVGEARGIVVFHHGFTGSKEDFVLVLPELAARGWHAIGFDYRGTYESTGTAPFGRQQLARDLVAVGRWARTRFGTDLPLHVVGHSYGGLVAQQAVADHPDAFTSLLLMCSGPAGVEVEGADEQQITIGRAREFRDLIRAEGVERAWDAKAELENLDMSNPFAKFLRERFVTTESESFLATLDDLLHTPDLVEDVKASGIPVRWSFGAGDGSWSQRNQRESARRYGTEAFVIPEPAMHSPCIENDEATVAWLDEVLAELS